MFLHYLVNIRLLLNFAAASVRRYGQHVSEQIPGSGRLGLSEALQRT